jgi:hypothetical protein
LLFRANKKKLPPTPTPPDEKRNESQTHSRVCAIVLLHRKETYSIQLKNEIQGFLFSFGLVHQVENDALTQRAKNEINQLFSLQESFSLPRLTRFPSHNSLDIECLFPFYSFSFGSSYFSFFFLSFLLLLRRVREKIQREKNKQV